MFKKILFTTSILLCLKVCIVNAQTKKKVDSMQQILPKQKGIERIKTLNELAWELQKEKDSVGIKYAEEALKLSKQERYYKGISDAYSRLGTIAYRQKNYEVAASYFFRVLVLDKEQNYEFGIARASNQLGMIYKRAENFTKAKEYYLDALAIFKKLEEYKQASQVAGNLGKLYLDRENYKKALQYYDQQLELNKQIGATSRISSSHENLGDVYKALENYEEALNSYQKVEQYYLQKKNKKEQLANIMIKIAAMYDYLDEDEASKQKYYDALQFIQKHKTGDLGALYFNLGVLYRKLGKKDSTTYYYEKAEKLLHKKKDKKELLIFYNNAGNRFRDLKNYKEALFNYNQSLALQKVVKDSSVMGKTYASISKIQRALGNLELALVYSDSAALIRKAEFDQIKNANQYQIASANAKKELIDTQYEREKTQNKAEKQLIYIVALCIALLLLTGLFFYIIKAKKQKQQRILAEADLQQQKLIAKHEKEQQELQLQELIKTQEMKAINAMINGQEEERKRIAQDLHDNLGSKLSLVKIHYQSVEDNLESIDEEAKIQYDRANQLLDEACKSVREISHNMISGTLSKFGLIPALKELKQTLENVYSKQNSQRIYIELTYHKLDNRLENTMEIQIYRIIQELLNNIMKHAQATQVNIQILKLEKGVNIIVEDNGIGFDTTKQHKGIGLKTIQSRVVNMNGNYLIDSGKGNGTTVTIDIPT
ncbi:signal transduction histidine kinase [Kordia periserrulae]|uniref:Oxygen sensor histidine kinase NreB n=1 Tax=Kordia periserrulae TaxID=701523 RepID=A0A2T6BRV4_9FLAO|nr:sensor histidine kinase [Kordia periserrulae]PTX58823.1 signal transduction histidine kinase [Kordia periserrulae]